MGQDKLVPNFYVMGRRKRDLEQHLPTIGIPGRWASMTGLRTSLWRADAGGDLSFSERTGILRVRGKRGDIERLKTTLIAQGKPLIHEIRPPRPFTRPAGYVPPPRGRRE